MPDCVWTQRGGSSRGFTFIELLVVMMIIAIAFFALRPSFGGAIEGARERTAVRQLVGMLTAARSEAVARGKLVRVVFDPTQRAFFAELQSAPELDRTAFEPLSLLGRQIVRVPAHLRLASLEVGGSGQQGLGRTDIYFYPDGRTDGVAMVFARERGEDVRLVVAPATGRIRVDG